MRLFLALLLASLLAAGSLMADAVDDKVRGLVDNQSYTTHQRLIEIIFRDRAQFFLEDGRLDVIKVVNTLKENGLLDIFYRGTPRDLKATFRSAQNPTFYLKAITDVLAELGYNFYITAHMRQDEYLFEWAIAYKSDHAIDPALLARRLAAYGVVIEDINKEQNNWIYDLIATEPTLPDAHPLLADSEEPLTLLSPQGEYWIALDELGQKVGMRRRTGGVWFPYAAFYDRDLRILKVYALERGVRTFAPEVPDGAAYLKLTDNYTTENLRHGIVLWLESNP